MYDYYLFRINTEKGVYLTGCFVSALVQHILVAFECNLSTERASSSLEISVWQNARSSTIDFLRSWIVTIFNVEVVVFIYKNTLLIIDNFIYNEKILYNIQFILTFNLIVVPCKLAVLHSIVYPPHMCEYLPQPPCSHSYIHNWQPIYKLRLYTMPSLYQLYRV